MLPSLFIYNFIYLFIYLFIYGCAESSLLYAVVLQLQRVRATLVAVHGLIIAVTSLVA